MAVRTRSCSRRLAWGVLVAFALRPGGRRFWHVDHCVLVEAKRFDAEPERRATLPIVSGAARLPGLSADREATTAAAAPIAAVTAGDARKRQRRKLPRRRLGSRLRCPGVALDFHGHPPPCGRCSHPDREALSTA